MKAKHIFGGALIALSVLLPVFGMASASAVTCPNDTVNAGKEVENLAFCNIKEDNSVMPTVTNIINVVIAVVGILAVMVMIYGGFQYMTSSGDGVKAKKARDTILYGVIGLVISILAYAIINFVLGIF